MNLIIDFFCIICNRTSFDTVFGKMNFSYPPPQKKKTEENNGKLFLDLMLYRK